MVNRSWLLVVACVGGCATTPPDVARTHTLREFFDTMRSAIDQRDARNLWKLSSKKAQARVMETMRSVHDKARRDPQSAQALKESLGLDRDPAAIDLEELVIASIDSEMRPGYFQGTPQWVEAKENGDEAVLTVEWSKGNQRRENQFLIREDGLWRYR